MADITDADQPVSFSKDELADYLGVTPGQLDEVVEEYHLAPLPAPIPIGRARELRDKLSLACTVIELAEMKGGHTPPRRPTWVQAPGHPARQFPEI